MRAIKFSKTFHPLNIVVIDPQLLKRGNAHIGYSLKGLYLIEAEIDFSETGQPYLSYFYEDGPVIVKFWI